MTSFTIIIATCGRPERLARVLDCLDAAIRASGTSHAVVVADNHPDYTAKAAADAFRDRTGHAVVYLATPSHNKCAALNRAIDVATTEWLAFTDDDTLPDPDWLAAAAQYAENPGVRVFGGRIQNGTPEPPAPVTVVRGRFGRMPAGGLYVWYDPAPATGLLPDQAPAPLGANLFAHRSVFESVGTYCEYLWTLCGRHALGIDDGEFGIRLKRHGLPIGYCREALVVHPVWPEKYPFRRRLRNVYAYGWRDAMSYYEGTPTPVPWYRGRMALRFAVLVLHDLFLGDRSGAVACLLEVARNVGMVAGRLSPAYRRLCRECDGAPGDLRRGQAV